MRDGDDERFFRPSPPRIEWANELNGVAYGRLARYAAPLFLSPSRSLRET